MLTPSPFQLRPFTDRDLDLVREAASDPHIPLITTVPAAFTDEAGRAFIRRQHERARSGAGYSFAIAEESSGRAVGQIGLWLRDIDQGRASVGYWVVKPARGRRAATFALRAVSRWALTELAIPRIELYVEPWNAASIRTAEEASFVREGMLRAWEEVGGERRDMLMYSRLPTD